MSNEILVALIGLAGSAIGSLCGILVSNKLAMYRIEQLERKVEKHNNLVERTYQLEQREELLEEKLEAHETLYAEKLKVANHRIKDLERDHHEN